MLVGRFQEPFQWYQRLLSCGRDTQHSPPKVSLTVDVALKSVDYSRVSSAAVCFFRKDGDMVAKVRSA